MGRLGLSGGFTVVFVGIIDGFFSRGVVFSLEIKQRASFISGRAEGAQAVFGHLGTFACFFGKHGELL